MTGPSDEAKYLPKELRMAIPIEDRDISKIFQGILVNIKSKKSKKYSHFCVISPK